MPYPGDPGVATINGVSYDPVNLAFPGGVCTDGIYWGLPPLGIEPDYSGDNFDETLVKFVGERTGIVLKRLNFSERFSWIDLVLVGAPATVRPQKRTLIASLLSDGSGNPIRYSVQMPDDPVTQNGFRLLPFSSRCMSKTIAAGKIAVLVPCVFQQLSLSN